MTTPRLARVHSLSTLSESAALDGHDTVLMAMISTVRDADVTDGEPCRCRSQRRRPKENLSC
jgi:hypothetical protein